MAVVEASTGALVATGAEAADEAIGAAEDTTGAVEEATGAAAEDDATGALDPDPPTVKSTQDS